ncbi:MAG TPA: hypothetical protein VGQ83_42730 [Polyangia bacterium]|jgi:hypothetical protein
MTPLRLPLTLALVVAAVGCGRPLADAEYAPSYGTIQGNVTSAESIPGSVRVALVWLTIRPGEGAFRIAQDTPVQAGFPATYRLDIRSLPPAEAVMSFFGESRERIIAEGTIDPELRWAQGELVAYVDGNGNGQLDVVGPGEASPDRVIGKAEGVTVWFVMSGTPAPSDYWGYPTLPGLSASYSPVVDPQPGECVGWRSVLCGNNWGSDSHLLPLPATVDIALSFEPHLNGYTCRRFWSSNDWPDWSSYCEQSPASNTFGTVCQSGATLANHTCTPVTAESPSPCALDLPPAGVPVTCNADGSAYVYKTCVDEPELCGTRICHFGHGERKSWSPVPAGWPCP